MEYTIEQLVDDLVENARWDGICSGMINHSQSKLALENSRSALLSHITQIEKERDEWKKRTEKLEAVTLISTRELTQDEIDYAGTIDTSDAENKVIASLRKEADEWRETAGKLAEKLFDCAEEDSVSGSFGSGCMSNPDVYIADVKNEYRALALRYPHVDEKGKE